MMKVVLIILVFSIVWLILSTLALGAVQVYYNSDGEKWIEDENGVRLTTLKDFKEYKDADGQDKLKLVSEMGFSLDNIPMMAGKKNVRFYGECIDVFLNAEKHLPLCMKHLKKKGYKARALKTMRFKFPDEPVIDKATGRTRFLSHTEPKIWLAGWYSGGFIDSDYCVVTSTPTKWHENVILHEYIHACGYDGSYHSKDVFQSAKIRIITKK